MAIAFIMSIISRLLENKEEFSSSRKKTLKCHYCGIYFPAHEAIKVCDLVFCCDAHAKKQK